MKTLRRLLVPLSLLVMFLGLAVTGTKAQIIRQTHFTGTFTLPFTVQWGEMILPPGEYTLRYGTLTTSGPHVIEVARAAMGFQHGVVAVLGQNDGKVTQNVLVCVREGNKGYVRSLQMAETGVSLNFKRPHYVEVESWIVSNKFHSTNNQIAVVRIPVAPVK